MAAVKLDAATEFGCDLFSFFVIVIVIVVVDIAAVVVVIIFCPWFLLLLNFHLQNLHS